jgi:hypothetical protein
MKVLVLDAMGVIYPVGNDVPNLLCPFIAAKHGDRMKIFRRAAAFERCPGITDVSYLQILRPDNRIFINKSVTIITCGYGGIA